MVGLLIIYIIIAFIATVFSLIAFTMDTVDLESDEARRRLSYRLAMSLLFPLILPKFYVRGFRMIVKEFFKN